MEDDRGKADIKDPQKYTYILLDVSPFVPSAICSFEYLKSLTFH